MTSRRTNDFERFLDRYVGIPLVAALGLRRKHAFPHPSTIERIGLLKTGGVGDTLLLAGSFEALHAAYPNARVTLITSHENAGVAPLFARAIDEHLEISVRSPVNAIKALRAHRLDMLIECGPWPRVDALLAALSGARYTIGFRVRGQARHFALDRVVEHSSQSHQVENFRQLVRAAGASQFAPPHVARAGRLAHDRLPPQPYVVFHPWSGGYMGWVKEWPSERWEALALRLHAARGCTVVVSGGRRDIERSESLVTRLRAAGAPAINAAGTYSIAEMTDVLCEADVVISVNTGIMHLAALLGAPTVSLEGPVPVHRWGPIGPRTRSVVTTTDDCGYLDLGFEYAGHCLTCMEGVSVDAVVAAIDELVEFTTTRGARPG